MPSFEQIKQQFTTYRRQRSMVALSVGGGFCVSTYLLMQSAYLWFALSFWLVVVAVLWILNHREKRMIFEQIIATDQQMVAVLNEYLKSQPYDVSFDQLELGYLIKNEVFSSVFYVQSKAQSRLIVYAFAWEKQILFAYRQHRLYGCSVRASKLSQLVPLVVNLEVEPALIEETGYTTQALLASIYRQTSQVATLELMEDVLMLEQIKQRRKDFISSGMALSQASRTSLHKIRINQSTTLFIRG